MAVKLEKLLLPSVPEIKSLEQEALVRLAIEMRERIEYYQGILFRVQKKQFGRSSERSPKDNPADSPKEPAPRGETTKKLSERYPDAPIQVNNIGFDQEPCCPECGKIMQDSGMTEDSEYLTVVPKQFIVIRQVRQKSRCDRCHSSIVTAPNPKRIIPKGSYSDEMIVDATLSKYCDLSPMERYCQMAARSGLLGLPPHSLIVASMKLAKFLCKIYSRIRAETLNTKLLRSDETSHKMLEGDPKKNWFLWAFSSKIACFFECHDTRSGDVSTSVLKDSICEFLLSDVYSGYSKSLTIVNKERVKNNQTVILAAYCNAHARRYFKDRDSDEVCEDAESMVAQYKEIYELNKQAKNQSPEVVLELRSKMKPLFEAMKQEALLKIKTYSNKSQIYKAYYYFIENYDGLTRFLDNHFIEIDNNFSERLLRNHVIGRKTWYGTHSKRAAETAAIHFSIVETCKMNRVNPREFYLDAVNRIHTDQTQLTPYEYKQLQDSNTC